MCGAYGYSVKDEKEVYDRFEVTNTLARYKPRWNVRLDADGAGDLHDR